MDQTDQYILYQKLLGITLQLCTAITDENMEEIEALIEQREMLLGKMHSVHSDNSEYVSIILEIKNKDDENKQLLQQKMDYIMNDINSLKLSKKCYNSYKKNSLLSVY